MHDFLPLPVNLVSLAWYVVWHWEPQAAPIVQPALSNPYLLKQSKMKSFLKGLHGEGKKDPLSLVGKVIQCSQFSVMVEEAIGAGGFASIYRVRDQPTGQTYALKHLRLPQDSDAVADVRQEMRTMAHLGTHPNILKLHAASFAGPAGKETDAFMVMDFAPITLLDMMQRSNFQLDDFFVHEVFQEVCHAIAHMHNFSPPYAHRDIKAENVLKTTKGKWVLCDFGSATTKAQVFETPAEIAMEEDVIRRTTTPAYRAPEMWDLMGRQRIDTKVDIWALGVLLYVLVFGKLPFQGDSKLSVLFGKYEMPPGKPPLVCSLIRDMLTTDPAARPDIMAVLGRLDAIKQALLQSVGAPSPGPAPAPIATVPVPLQPPAPAQLQLPGQARGSFPVPPDPGAPAGPLAAALSATQLPVQQHARGPSPGHANGQPAMPSMTPVMPSQLQRASGGHYPSIPAHPGAPPVSASPPSNWPPKPETVPLPASASPQTAPHASPTHAVAARTRPDTKIAASTPLFVPSEGALQLSVGSALSLAPSGASFSTAAARQQPEQPQQPAQPQQAATGTLIDVDPGPAGDATKSLLGEGFSPMKKAGHHRHKKSSSFSQDLLAGSAGIGHGSAFEPDWGDQPAFGGAHAAPPASAAGVTHHPRAHNPPHQGLPHRPSNSGVATPGQPSSGRPSLSGPPRTPEAQSDGSGGGGVQGSTTTPTSNLEMDTLRVTVKGLTSTQASLLARVKQLEDLVSDQAALIKAMQQEMSFKSRASGSGSGAGGGVTSPGGGQRRQSGPVRTAEPQSAGDVSSTARAPSGATWHAFDADGAPTHQ